MQVNQVRLGAVLSYVSMGLSTLISLIYTPIMLGRLGETEYGVYGAVGPIISYLLLLSMGLGSAYIRYYSQAKVAKDRREMAKLNGMFLVTLSLLGLVLLALGQWSLFLAAEDVSWLALLLIPAATRACAGLAVLGLRPMGTSQYAAMGPARGGYGAALWVLLALSVGLPLWLDGSFGPLAAAVGYGQAVWYGFRNLDGMSGDISGFALTLGELCGCGAAILWR